MHISTSVEQQQKGCLLKLTLHRPKANAINTETSKELASALQHFQDDPNLWVAIITGSGDRFFSAGWDLKAGEAVDADHGPGGFAGITEFFTLDKPVIAAVNGLAVGGGFELALACDFILAAEHAEFFLPEASLGIMPDSGGILRVPKILPHNIAMETLMLGRHIHAEEAVRYGLVNAVVPIEELADKAEQFANSIMESAPLSIAAMKEILRNTETTSVQEGFRIMRSGQLKTYMKMLHSEDADEGQRAFAEKREPIWKGK